MGRANNTQLNAISVKTKRIHALQVQASVSFMNAASAAGPEHVRVRVVFS